MTDILRDANFIEACNFIVELADEDHETLAPDMLVSDITGETCTLSETAFGVPDHLCSDDTMSDDEADALVQDACEKALAEHFDIRPRTRRIVRARRVLQPIPTKDLPLVAQAAEHYISALRGMLSQAIDTLRDDMDHDEPLHDLSAKYAEYDALDAPVRISSRLARMTERAPRVLVRERVQPTEWKAHRKTQYRSAHV